MFLSKIVHKQHRIYSDAADFGFRIKGNIVPTDEDVFYTSQLRDFIRRNKEFGKITQSKDFKTSPFGWWKFTYDMIEGEEDGHKYGAIAEITLNKEPYCEYINVALFDPNR